MVFVSVGAKNEVDGEDGKNTDFPGGSLVRITPGFSEGGKTILPWEM